MRLILAVVCLVITAFRPVTADESGDVRLTLPPAVYAIPGGEFSIWFDNIVLSQSSDVLQFHVTCDVGENRDDRWTVVPASDHVGDHSLSVRVSDLTGKALAEATTVLKVVPASAGAGQSIRMLIIGDSLTHASVWPNETAGWLSRPDNPRWSMLGTHRPASAAEGVSHEGYGGWTWSRFVTHYEPDPDGTYRKRSSPFVFLNDQQKPELDLEKYFRDSAAGQRPDYVIIMLGINDCFGAPPDDAAEMDARIDQMFSHADSLLNALRVAAPRAQIGVCLTTPPNSRQAAFEANYQERYTRWGWKRIQHRLVQRQIRYISERNDPMITVVPTELNLDPVDGYPDNNAVHPNSTGYRQIGAAVYYWLKWRLSQRGE
ncbi:MAG: hypothetical protein KDA96_16450 [Planctomycetaceae bacterium]|nr:hypothetical protein [Planctomycetaceae bacterium]